MTKIGLLAKWLKERNPAFKIADNGLRSIAIGSHEPSGHVHYVAYIFETDDGQHVRVYSNEKGRNEEIMIADPSSFEKVYKQVSVKPALCKECEEARRYV